MRPCPEYGTNDGDNAGKWRERRSGSLVGNEPFWLGISSDTSARGSENNDPGSRSKGGLQSFLKGFVALIRYTESG